MSHLRKTRVNTAVILGMLSVSVSCARSSPATREFTLQATTVQTTDIDVDGNGMLSQGDQSIFTTALTREGSEVGTGHAVCTVTRVNSPDDAFRKCLVSFDLADGQITAQALVGNANFMDFTEDITGGTDAYRNAGGEIQVLFVEDIVRDLRFSIDDLG
ncbi:MAG: allene oxide cyclase barrel-like domain-containing protein [Egibacteraceae bacterium]